jgi:hypothetical protein
MSMLLIQKDPKTHANVSGIVMSNEGGVPRAIRATNTVVFLSTVSGDD